MQKWKTILLISIFLVGIGSTSTFAYVNQQRLSNEVDSYTHLNLNLPIRLTKVGDLPWQTIPSENYSLHFIIENLGKKDCQGKLVVAVGYVVYLASPPNCSEPRYPVLTPDMVTVCVSFSDFVDHWNNAFLELTYNQAENALVGYTPTFTMPIGFYKNVSITVNFNDNAYTDTNYCLRVWISP